MTARCGRFISLRRDPMMRYLRLLLVLSLAANCFAQTSKPKVRAITGFVRLDHAQYQQQIADTLLVLREAKKQFEASGYELDKVRITLQPLSRLDSEMSDAYALAYLKALDALSVKENVLPNV